jgi:hypothetical protein
MISMEGGSKFRWLMFSLFEGSASGSTVLLKAAVLSDLLSRSDLDGILSAAW